MVSVVSVYCKNFQALPPLGLAVCKYGGEKAWEILLFCEVKLICLGGDPSSPPPPMHCGNFQAFATSRFGSMQIWRGEGLGDLVTTR